MRVWLNRDCLDGPEARDPMSGRDAATCLELWGDRASSRSRVPTRTTNEARAIRRLAMSFGHGIVAPHENL